MNIIGFNGNEKLKAGNYHISSTKEMCVKCKYCKKVPEWLICECMHEDYFIEDERCIYCPSVESYGVCDKYKKKKD